MSTKTVHLSLSVRGALQWPNWRLAGLVIDGKRVTAGEAREALFDQLAAGNELLPMGDCEGHDPKEGCPGHPEVTS